MLVILLTRPSADKVGIYSMLTMTVTCTTVYIGSQQGVTFAAQGGKPCYVPVSTSNPLAGGYCRIFVMQAHVCFDYMHLDSMHSSQRGV